MRFYIAAVQLADFHTLGSYRTVEGLSICYAENLLWLRGLEAAAFDWSKVPAVQRFTAETAEPSAVLTLLGHRLPSRSMPSGTWRPLKDELRPQPFAPHLPAQAPAPVPWTLEPSSEPQEPVMLRLSLPALAKWVQTAPSARWRSLRFCASPGGEACVIGNPLPSLAGQYWWALGSLAMPAGYTLPLGIRHDVVTVTLGLNKAEIALIYPDGTYDRIPAEAFLPCNPANVAATVAAA